MSTGAVERLGLVTAFVGTGALASGIGEQTVRLALATVLAAGLVGLLVGTTRNSASGSSGDIAPGDLLRLYGGTEPFVDSASMLYNRYYNEVIDLFSRMFLRDDYRLRLQESLVETGGGFGMVGRVDYAITGRERAAISLRAADDNIAGSVIVPFMWSAKGSLYRDLVVTDPSGGRLTLLAQSDVTALVAVSVEPLVREIFGVDPDDDMSLAQRTAAQEIGALVGIPDPVDPDVFLEAFDAIVGRAGVRPGEKLDRLKALIRFFAGGYLLAAEAPLRSDGHVGVSYSFAVTSESPNAFSPTRRLRRLFGLADPVQVVSLAESASLFQSYHLGVQGPKGGYARKTALYRIGRDNRPYRLSAADLVDARKGVPSVRGSRTNPGRIWEKLDPGGSSAHLHLNNLPTTLSNLAYGVTYDEVPPGSLPPIIAMTFVNATVTFVLSVTVPSVANPIDFNAPALMLAIPIFAITIFGFSFDRLVRSSIFAALGYLGAATLTTVGAVLSVLGQPSVPKSAEAFWGGGYRPFLLLERVYLPLMGCAIASLALSLAVFGLLTWKLWCYRRWQNSVSRSP